MADTFTDGLRFRMLAVVDDFTRQCLGLVADTLISWVQAAGELDTLVRRHGKLDMTVSDNGTELTSTAILSWSKRNKGVQHDIMTGKPPRNTFIESLYGRPGAELLNEPLFQGPAHAQAVLAA